MTDAPKKSSKFFASDRNKVTAVIIGSALLIGASFGVQAVAESKPYQHLKLVISADEEQPAYSNPFMHTASYRGDDDDHRGHHRFSKMTDAEIEKKITRVVKHVAIEIDATPEQETKITTLVTALAKDMRPLRGEFKAAGKQMHDLLLAPTIDRDAMEKIRAERFAAAEKASKEIVSAVAEVAETLNLEQRQILEKRMKQFRKLRRRWHRG